MDDPKDGGQPVEGEAGGVGSLGSQPPGPQGSGSGSPRGVGSGAAALHYSIPGILHFLQHEWSRFEMERSQWEVEKAELQVSREG